MMQIEERIKSVWNRCDPEVQRIIDDLSYWAATAEEQLQILNEEKTKLMTITGPRLYAIYSNSLGFYLGQDEFGVSEFVTNPEYDSEVVLFPEKEGMEMLELINQERKRSNEHELVLVPSTVTVSFETIP